MRFATVMEIVGRVVEIVGRVALTWDAARRKLEAAQRKWEDVLGWRDDLVEVWRTLKRCPEELYNAAAFIDLD
jgi:hypothetical protein